MRKRASRRSLESGPYLTEYQKWLRPALTRARLDVADLARALEREYSYVWKLVFGNPAQNDGRNKVQVRPSFEIAQQIGGILGDVGGSLSAAGYQISALLGGRVLTVGLEGGMSVHLVVPTTLPDVTARCLVSSVGETLTRMSVREDK